jgi:toxin ParE1/3/4
VIHKFHPDALEEYREAVRFYEAARVGLGRRFDNEVRITIKRIVQNPTQWRIFEEDVRVCSVGVFPYQILYTVEPDHVLIVAVKHDKRHPDYWRYRRRP